jgi:hypothetical protein
MYAILRLAKRRTTYGNSTRNHDSEEYPFLHNHERINVHKTAKNSLLRINPIGIILVNA